MRTKAWGRGDKWLRHSAVFVGRGIWRAASPLYVRRPLFSRVEPCIDCPILGAAVRQGYVIPVFLVPNLGGIVGGRHAR